QGWCEFDQQTSWRQRWTILPRARAKMRRIKQYYVWREQCRSDMIRIITAVRRWHLVLAARFVAHGWLEASDQYFLLTLDEIGEVIADATKAPRLETIVTERRLELERN